jgi:heat shock protein 4
MFMQDFKIIEVKEMKNSLESYVYEMRAHLDTYGERSKFIEDGPREAFLATLSEREAWLYDEGANTSKDLYEEKLNELKFIGEPINKRYRFHDIYEHKAQ